MTLDAVSFWLGFSLCGNVIAVTWLLAKVAKRINKEIDRW